jgi:hypothetical protein
VNELQISLGQPQFMGGLGAMKKKNMADDGTTRVMDSILADSVSRFI